MYHQCFVESYLLFIGVNLVWKLRGSWVQKVQQIAQDWGIIPDFLFNINKSVYCWNFIALENVFISFLCVMVYKNISWRPHDLLIWGFATLNAQDWRLCYFLTSDGEQYQDYRALGYFNYCISNFTRWITIYNYSSTHQPNTALLSTVLLKEQTRAGLSTCLYNSVFINDTGTVLFNSVLHIYISS